MFADSLLFKNVPKKTVDLDVIRAFIEDENPKRINFASHHANALRRNNKPGVVGRIVLPFDDNIEPIVRNYLGVDRFLFPSQFDDSFYRQIHSEDEYAQIAAFIERFKQIVFLRDTLDLSIALSMHENEPGQRTELGEHEYQVKYQQEKTDTSKHLSVLTSEMQRNLEDLPFFKFADYVCSVPSTKPFIRQIIEGLEGFAFTDISAQISWDNKNGSFKNVETANEKLDMIQSWGLRIAEGLELKDKNILLLDDMYHSGVTMQYIAMKLKESGARRVFGVALVKSLGN